MKGLLILFSIAYLLPGVVFALDCSADGFTVVYVNGILTTRDEANTQRINLEDEFTARTGRKDVFFRNGYNDSHFAGGGDFLESAAQAFGASISDFDLNTILMQIQPQVSTRKILLLGHSQGTFYTNAMYQYLLKNGVPKESLAVYNLATPASHVEGGGAYLTSTNDRLINGIRPLMAKAGAPAPLPANITIPIPENELSDKAGGHHFSSDYLGGAAERIVADIENALNGLKADSLATSDGCFTPPPSTLGYKAQSVALAVADATSNGVKTADVAAVNAIGNASFATGRALGTGIIITGKAVVYAANVVTVAVIYAAQKAADAAAYAASQIRNVFTSATNAAGKVSASSQVAAIPTSLSPPPTSNNQPTIAAPVPTPATTKAITAAPTIAPKAPDPPAPAQVQPTIPTPPPQAPPSFGPALVSVAPGFGGGGQSPVPAPSPAATVSPPVYVPFSVQAPNEGALFATTSVAFTGTTTPSYSVVASYASTSVVTVAGADGNWSMALALQEGMTTVGIVATDSAGNTSDAITRTISVDTTPPAAPSPSVSECSASLSAQFCLIPATSITLAWAAVPSIAYYAYAINGATIATTTSTSATLALTANASSTLSVAAYDTAGNAATSTPVEVYAIAQPLIINEIAWAGTKANNHDQWIELKNVSPYEIDNLSFVALVAADGDPYIQLRINVNPNFTYLIKRRSEATNVVGDLVILFTELSQSGEELYLQWGSGSATTTIDSTPAVAACTGWCPSLGAFTVADFLANPMSMERKPGTSGSLAESWQWGVSTSATVTDAAGNAIQGTPRAENSGGGIWAPIPDILFAEN